MKAFDLKASDTVTDFPLFIPSTRPALFSLEDHISVFSELTLPFKTRDKKDDPNMANRALNSSRKDDFTDKHVAYARPVRALF